jgi:hypothetical protein
MVKGKKGGRREITAGAGRGCCNAGQEVGAECRRIFGGRKGEERFESFRSVRPADVCVCVIVKCFHVAARKAAPVRAFPSFLWLPLSSHVRVTWICSISLP